jgi:uncharacterized protein YdaU (DUF1376 family)
MSLVLPYFKLDVIDCLQSERIEAMSTACVGSYFLLLCEAWTRPSCSLPRQPADLMRLGRWTGTVEEFAPVLACFTTLKSDKSRVVNARLKQEWDEATAKVRALSEAGKRGAQIKQKLREQAAPTPRKPAIRTLPVEGFEQFWAAYPKKEDKKEAHRAFEKALKKTTLASVLQGLTRATVSETWTKDNGKYIPLPSTWLNKERWSDQPTPSNGLTPRRAYTDPIPRAYQLYNPTKIEK